MNEQDALLETIFDNPEDDAPRLIYSDWLEDHDLPWSAKFVRFHVLHPQIQLTHWQELFNAWCGYREEINVAKAWANLRGEPAFERGFPVKVYATVSALRDDAGEWWPAFPATRISCTVTPLEVEEFIRAPYLSCVRELQLDGDDPHGLVIPRIAKCHYLNNLRELDLSACTIGIEAVEALANTDLFSRLTALRLPSSMRPNGGSAKLLRKKYGNICQFGPYDV